jgi:hypothetical protein
MNSSPTFDCASYFAWTARASQSANAGRMSKAEERKIGYSALNEYRRLLGRLTTTVRQRALAGAHEFRDQAKLQ